MRRVLAHLAYAQGTVSVLQTMAGGRRVWSITFTETGASSTSEWTISSTVWTNNQLPRAGVITLYAATLTAGTGTTIQPKVMRATGAATTSINHIGQVTAPAQHISDATGVRFDGVSALFGVSTPNDATADHSITTEITIMEGHS